MERRVVKRYSNRKLYDTKDSRYVTLLQIAEIIRAGEDVQIIDNSSKEDKTDVTLALIISEELRAQPRALPLATLKALIQNRGERLLSQFRIRPIGRLLAADAASFSGERDRAAGETDGSLPDQDRAGGERQAPDEAPKGQESSDFEQLLTAIRRLSERLDAMEGRLAERDGPKG